MKLKKQDRRILYEASGINRVKQSNRPRYYEVEAIPTSDEFFDPTGFLVCARCQPPVLGVGPWIVLNGVKDSNISVLAHRE